MNYDNHNSPEQGLEEMLSPLAQIEAVEAPPFLLTRIHQAIATRQQAQQRSMNLSPRLAWSLGVSFVLVLLLNVYVLTRTAAPAPQEAQVLAQAMQLLPNNALYE